jgi:hypothetical protein
MPANGGLLRIRYRSPGSQIGRCRREIADSLQRIFEIFPFLGDRDRRPGFDRHCVADAAVQSVVYWDMADGQVVLVTTEPLGGGSPVRSVYFVAEQDPEKAKAIIGAMMAPNEKVPSDTDLAA